MSPMTKAEITSHLRRSTTRKARMFMYTNLLGLRKLSQSKSRAGPPAYSGIVKDFYEAVKAGAHQLSKKYDSLIKLDEEIKTQENFSETIIDDIVRVYGPVIWNDGSSGFLTITDNEEDNEDDKVYPRHLIFNNESDRVSIRTFIYCLTLERTCRNMRSTGLTSGDDLTIQTEWPYAAPRDPRAGNSNATAPDPDTVSAEPTENITTSAPSNANNNRRLQEVYDHQAPVARMIPTINTEGVSLSSTMPQPDTAAISLVIRSSSTDTEDHRQSSDTSHADSLYKPTRSLDQASSTNSGPRGETRQFRLLRKRRRSLQGGEADTNPSTQQSALSTFRSVRVRRRDFSDGVSCPTSTRMAPEAIDMSEGQGLRDTCSNQTTRSQTGGTACAFQSNVRTNTTRGSDNDATAITSIPVQHHRITDPDIHMSEGNVDEVDSVVGSPRPPLIVEGQDEDNEPMLIVKLKVKSPEEIQLRRQYRRRLAVKLPSAFEMSSQQTKVLEEVVALVRGIREIDTPRSQSGSGNSHGSYQLVLDQWLELVDIYLRFRKDTDFNDDLSTWATYRNSLNLSESIRKDQIHNEASLDIWEWSCKHKKHNTEAWWKCATNILLDMAEWRCALKEEQADEIRRRFVEFNQSIVEWSA